MLQQRLLQPGPSGGASPLCSFQKAAYAERYTLTAYQPFLMLRALTTVTTPEQRNKISSAHSLCGFFLVLPTLGTQQESSLPQMQNPLCICRALTSEAEKTVDSFVETAQYSKKSLC